jgi:hypothetical protein
LPLVEALKEGEFEAIRDALTLLDHHLGAGLGDIQHRAVAIGAAVDDDPRRLPTPLACLRSRCLVGSARMRCRSAFQIVAARDRDWALLAFARDYEDRLFVHRWPPAFR